MRLVITLAVILLFGAGCAAKQQDSRQRAILPNSHGRENLGTVPKALVSDTRVDFAQFNPIFRFSAELPLNWQVEYVREIEALNVYGPAQAAMPARELSQIFK